MIKKFTSIILAILILVGTMSCLSTLSITANAATGQPNAVARAYYFYNKTWVCQKQVNGWRNNYTFYKGSTYRAPYGQPAIVGKYIGYAVSIDDWLTATKNASSEFYTKRSHYNYWYSTYYATDCSAFVSWCWGIARNTTATLNNRSTNIGNVTVANAQKLQIGDALNSPSVGHVVLLTGVTKNSAGTVTGIEITEQTPPQLKKSNHTPASLYSSYSRYTIRRYTGTVPAAPDGSTVSGGSSAPTLPIEYYKYYPACSSSETSLITALSAIGVDSSKEYRTKIAEFNGITDYSGTAEQNTTLMSLFKEGKLLNPDYVAPVYYPACDSSCTTIIEGLSNIGEDTSKETRAKIAAANGISDYSYTAEQNNQMLELLKEGKLIKYTTTTESSSATSSSSVEPTESTVATEDPTKYFPACASSETRLVTALKSINVDSSQENRKRIAAANGIADYTFTAEQNTQLLDLLKAGKLIDPDYIPPSTSATEPTEPSSSTEATQPSTEAPEDIDEAIYLVPGTNWETDSPRFAVHFYNLSGDTCWVTMTDNNGDGRYVANVPEGNWTNVIFCRMNPDYENGWDTATEDKVWNHTVDLTIDGNCFTITDPWSASNDNKALGTWSNFEEPLYYQACDSSITTLNEALSSIGVDNSKENRTRIAKVNGIIDYAFTAVQNNALLALLKEGKLINPEYRGEIPVDPIDGIDLGNKFTAFVYNITSWKLLTPDNNGNAIINQKNGDGLQLLTFEKDTDGSYVIYTNDRRCLTVESNSAASGTNVKFVSHTGASGQKWSIQGEDGKYKLQAWCSPSCHLEVVSNGRTNGTNIQCGSTTTGNEQFFQILQYECAYTKTGYENGYISSGKAGSAGTGKIVAKGIDVSKWNEKDGSTDNPSGYETAEFNFAGIKNAGYDYVIIRAGSTNLGEDPMFDKYYEKAKAAGLEVGAYFYSFSLTPSEARSDAKKFLSYVEGKKFEYPLYLDFEEKTQDALDEETSKSVCLTFMTMMANEGYLTGVYTGVSMASGMNMDDICENYESWIARYYDTDGSTWSPTYSKLYGMYQYSSECAVPSSTWSGAVMDVNYSYKDYPSIVKQYGFNGYSQGSWSADGKFVFADGSTATGWLEYDGSQYYFDEKGNVVNGWVQAFGTWYYFNEEGILTDTSQSVIGDVDNSGKLDINDTTYIQKILARYIEPTDALVKIADVNGNGRIDIRDATYIQLYLGKFINYFKKLLF